MSKVTPSDQNQENGSLSMPAAAVAGVETLNVKAKKADLTSIFKSSMANMGIEEIDGEEYSDGRYKNLSYDKMISQVELTHPRRQVDGKSELIPLCTKIGNFWMTRDPDEKNDIDQVGIGTVMYFKLLKFIIGFFIFATIL